MATVFAPVERTRRRRSSGARPRSPTSARSGGRWRRCARMRPRDRGVIVQVGSALAYRGIPLQAAYCGAKHALQGFLESLRTELLHDGSNVRLTMVQLPALNTPQFTWSRAKMPHEPQPVPPIFQPEVAADAIVWAAARRPARGDGRLADGEGDLGNAVAPGVADRYLARNGYEAQQTERPLADDRAGQPLRARRRATRARTARSTSLRDACPRCSSGPRSIAACSGSRASTALAAAAVNAVIGRSDMSQLVADYILDRLREWGVAPHLRLPGRRHQRHHRRARPRRRRPGVRSRCATRRWPRSWPARHAKFTGEVGVCLATSGPGRDPPAQRPLRREARPPAGRRDRRPAGARGARRRLPAGGRPARRSSRTSRTSTCSMATVPGADAAPGRPRGADRARRAHASRA